MKKYQLVLQFDAMSLKDYDRLVTFENKLAAQLSELADVDGHDFGSEEFNIFLLTDEPQKSFEKAHVFLKTQDIPNYMRAAYREGESDAYLVLWPPGLMEFSIS